VISAENLSMMACNFAALATPRFCCRRFTWGPADTIARLDGMIAFAYFDGREDTLWLARRFLRIPE
jgi:hypothetical protein